MEMSRGEVYWVVWLRDLYFMTEMYSKEVLFSLSLDVVVLHVVPGIMVAIWCTKEELG